MSPSTSRLGVPLEADDFDVDVRGCWGSRDQGSAGPVAGEALQGEGCEEANMKISEEGGDGPGVNTVPKNATKHPSLLQRDSHPTCRSQDTQGVDSSCTAVVNSTKTASGSNGGKCVGSTRCVRAAAGTVLQMKRSYAGILEHPATLHANISISLVPLTPTGISQLYPEPNIDRTKQDQRISFTDAVFPTRHLQPDTSLSAGHTLASCKEHVGKNLSDVAVNPFFGATSLGGRSSHPAGNLTSASAGARTPPRPWELRVLLLALLLAASVSARYDRGGPQHSITWGRGNTHNSAVFGNGPTNVTAVLGHRASLPCQVKNLGHKDVSWIRQRDLHILTVGIFTYTSDDRFKVFHPPETEDWFLEISSVTFRDSGVYECQVSTSPKVSLPIRLTVLAVQEAEIPGPHEVFIQHGSTISLQCEVLAGVEAVGMVRWYHGTDTLNYSSPRGGISMEVEKTPTKTTSKLYITRALRADSGNYTCAPKFSKPDSVIVHVVNGEESAAAVHSGVPGLQAGICMLMVTALVLTSPASLDSQVTPAASSRSPL